MNTHQEANPSTSAPKLVDTTGTARRLRALVAIGYLQTDLATRLGISPVTFSRLISAKQPRVAQRTHLAICALFIELWVHPVEGHAGDRSRKLARKHGWVSPLAWDDIDDPAETANTRGTKLRPAMLDLLDEIEFAAELDPELADLIDEVAVELAMSGDTVRLNFAERRQAVARLHGRKWSDKRIAAALHVTDRTVLRIRQRLGLEAFDFSEIRQVGKA